MKQRPLSNVRKANASDGDDTTLSRFVKLTAGERAPSKPKRIQPKFEGFANPSIEAGRSIFYRKGVKPVAALKHVLLSGHNNVKIGRDIRKGAFRGYWIYTLSLEERATCPRSCDNWQNCYGNNMPFASRVQHGPELLEALKREIPALLAVRGRRGIMIRLHALGDFYSPEYVHFWGRMLRTHPNLAVYGYTARRRSDPIGAAIARLKLRQPSRFRVRWSDGGEPVDCTASVVEPVPPPGAFLCPEQTGRTAACATCALCWATDKNVAFVIH